MVRIRIENISFAYRKVNVLTGLNLDFHQGRFTAIIGPNGSGKSTLLKCINGILKPQCGTLFFDGKHHNLFTRKELARLMAYVPQQEQQVFSSTVYETILLGRKPYISWAPSSKDYQIVNRVIKDLDLDNIALEYINELSGGQRQRVFIGRALAQQPQILLLDEPTANLDLKHQLEVLQLLKGLCNRNIMVIIAIHDLNLAAKYCDDLIMLNNGQLFASGDRSVLNQDNIKQLYGVDVKIIEDDNEMMILPLNPAQTVNLTK